MLRTAMRELESWKADSHKPLLILGARQTGKSWLMEEFARKNYSTVILEEIQEIPAALSSLKYIQEKMPQYHVMAAGSYLGTSLHRDSSFPVGKVDILQLNPMTFHEFLLAAGQDGLADLLQKGDLADTAVFDLRLQDMLK